MCNLLRQSALRALLTIFQQNGDVLYCYAMQINCLTLKELAYSTLTLPQKTQTNKTHYVETKYIG